MNEDAIANGNSSAELVAKNQQFVRIKFMPFISSYMVRRRITSIIRLIDNKYFATVALAFV